MTSNSDPFAAAHDFPRFEGTPRILVIASTPRSGSNMLGYTLYQTKAFGFPHEYLHPIYFGHLKRRFGTFDLEDTLREIQRHRTAANGVFGIKLHFTQVARWGGAHALQRLFPGARYVILSRENLVAQAVSYSLAKQTGAWMSGRERAGVAAQYDFKLIDRCLRAITRDSAAWRYLLATIPAERLELTFESMIADFPGTVSKIARFMDVELEPAQLPAQPATKSQRSTINQEWAERFVREHRGAPLFVEPARTARFRYENCRSRAAAFLKRSLARSTARSTPSPAAG